jgi:putative endonuclease
MYYVYHLKSEKDPSRYYVGLTTDVMRRLAEHNAGKSIHSNKFKPWRLISYTAFINKDRAEEFEVYL